MTSALGALAVFAGRRAMGADPRFGLVVFIRLNSSLVEFAVVCIRSTTP
jgi:hypothetical protein